VIPPFRINAYVQNRGRNAFLSVPSSALLDLGNVKLQQVVEPCEQFLSKRERETSQSVKRHNHDKFHVFSSIKSHLDSPIFSVVFVVVVVG
jgi:hypothetical protein